MSFILDALRRADAERERGEVPGLHARHVDPMPTEDEPGARSRRPLWIIGALAIALVAALAWILFGHDPRRSTTSGGAVSSVAPVAPTSAAPPVPAVTAAAPPSLAPKAESPVPGASAAVGVPAPSAAASTLAAARAARATRAAQRSAALAASSTGGGVAAARPNGAAPDAEGATSSSTVGAGDASSRVYQPKELPDAIRRELPAITVGGSTYSSERANRMLMINGQIFHEGDTVARGVVLQQIRPRAAVFVYKGYRYESAF